MLLEDMPRMLPNEIIYHLSQAVPAGWKAEETVLVRLSFDEDGDRLEFNLSDSEIHAEKDVDTFLRALARDPTPNPRQRRRPDAGRRNSLGIAVRTASNVVVVLNDKDWEFREGGPAITAKEDYGTQNYGSWHVMPNGDRVDIPARGCKIACFIVASREDNEVVQKFNLHLALLQQDGRYLEVTVDPDVPETGTEGFPLT